VFAETRHPISLITKGRPILCHLDLPAPMARDGMVSVSVSITPHRDAPREGLQAHRLRAIAAARQEVRAAGRTVDDSTREAAVAAGRIVPTLVGADEVAVIPDCTRTDAASGPVRDTLFAFDEGQG
jgi:hypothetical protein